MVDRTRPLTAAWRTSSAPTRRRVALAIATLAVITVHGCVAERLGSELTAWHDEAGGPVRLQVVYAREMSLSAPPPTARSAAPKRQLNSNAAGVRAQAATAEASEAAAPSASASAVAAAASSASSATSASADAATSADRTNADRTNADRTEADRTETDRTNADRIADALAAASAAAARAASAAGRPAEAGTTSAAASTAAPEPDLPGGFDWPASTRLSFTLTGYFRGPVQGSAQVEWIRAGAHYQVHLDLQVGPSFAPLVTRQLTSDGEITAAGLAPRSFVQDTQVVLQPRQHVAIRFGPDGVVLSSGERRSSVPGLQDTASQFVQLAYLFGTQPDLLQVGGAVELPVAMPRQIDLVTYDMVGEETLTTDFGPVPTLHLKPRFEPKPGELSAESWVAPQLRYLPVRIRIRQDAQTYVDLMIKQLPELAAR